MSRKFFEKNVNLAGGTVSKVVASGNVCCEGRSLTWEICDKDTAFLVNGAGCLVLSCPETVLEFDWDGEPLPRSLCQDNVRMEWWEGETTLHVYCKRNEKWVLLLRLTPEEKIPKAA